MSASRTLLLARSQKKEDDDDEDYDSEEERYQRNQDRLLRKVEESASAIRTITKITRPFITGSWRLEKEEKRNEELKKTMVKTSLTPCKENNPRSSTSNKGNDPRTSTTSVEETIIPLRKSIWSPVKHVRSTGISSVLEAEKTPSWRPLRKSKVRLSQIFHTENPPRSPSVCEDVAPVIHKSLPECITSSKPICKLSEDLRAPLRTVASLNQSQLRRERVSQSELHDTTSPMIHSSEMQASHKVSNAINAHEDVPEVENELNYEKGVEGTNETVNIPSALQDEVQQESLICKTPRILKSFKSPVRCSPILLQAYGKEHALVRGSIGSPDKVVNLDDCNTPKNPCEVLKGVVAYVEVRRGEDDRTSGFRWKLKQLGATVSETLNKKVTHVVFQEGLLSTFRKAKQLGAHIVSTHWVMACDESFTQVSEARYPIEKLSEYELADPHIKALKRPKIMSPDLGDDKKLTRRFKAIERRSMKVESPLANISHSAVSAIEEPETLIMKEDSLKLSPKVMPKAELDLDDDWDGFLAMVEAQVREKAQSRMDNGDDTKMDFETKLQLLLGRKKAEDKSDETSLPLALIFQKGKVPSAAHLKTSPKKVKRIKQVVKSTASSSSSVMMNWLQRRSPESRDLSSKAASAAADEIIQNMFKCIETEQRIKAGSVTQTTFSKSSSSLEKADQPVQTLRETKSKTLTSPKDTSKDIFVFAAKAEDTKSADIKKREVKRKKLDFRGSAASSGMMLNWLSGTKSPPPSLKSPGKNSTLQGSESSGKGNIAKRKANFSENSNLSKKHCKYTGFKEDVDKAPIVTCSPSKRPIKSCSSTLSVEAYQSESTPRKADSSSFLKSSSSAKEGEKDGCAALTPRRRSLRLTPMKASAVPRNSIQLGTVEEDKDCSFVAQETLNPESLSSSSGQDDLSGNATRHCSKDQAAGSKKPSPLKKTQKSILGEEDFVTKRQRRKASSGRKNSSTKSKPVSVDRAGYI